MTGGVSLSAGRCARRATEAGLGCGASWAEAEAGRRAGCAKLGQVRDAGLGRAGEKWCARGLKGGVRAGPKWARAERERAWARAGLGREVGCGLGFVWVRFGCGFALGFYFSISISFLCLTKAQLI